MGGGERAGRTEREGEGGKEGERGERRGEERGKEEGRVTAGQSDAVREGATCRQATGCGEKANLSLGNSHLESRGRSYSDTSVNSEDSRRRPVV